MNMFALKDSNEYYLQLSQQPVRFEPSSSVTNIFFDDTNGQVFTVRSGGVAGITVNGMDPETRTSFAMEDKGSITSIKFSPDQNILAIQRNRDNQNATVEFMNFRDKSPTNVQYQHSSKWKNARILSFVWPKNNEIAFITDHGIELFQVSSDKKVLKSLKNISFSAAWFSWCPQSKIVLLAGNNGSLLQPFLLNNSTISKLQKLDLDAPPRPIAERDVSLVRVVNTTWCAVIRPVCEGGPAELFLCGIATSKPSHLLRTGRVGRFAVNVVDHLIVVHHQASQTSQLFDIMEQCKAENGIKIHMPLIEARGLKPCVVDDQVYPLYSGHWKVQQPDYIIDVRLGCLWKVVFDPIGLAYQLPKDDISKIVAALLRRNGGRETIYKILNQLVAEGGTSLVELSKVFHEINTVYRKWAEHEVLKNTGLPAQQMDTARTPLDFRVVISQSEMYCHVLQLHADHMHIVQVITAYIASLSKLDLVVQHSIAEMCATTLVKRGQCNRLRQCIRHGCLGDSRSLACLLLSLSNVEPAAAQLATDMLWRLGAYDEIVEVLLSWRQPVSALSVCGSRVSLSPRKLLAATTDQHSARALTRLLIRRGYDLGDQTEPYAQQFKKIISD